MKILERLRHWLKGPRELHCRHFCPTCSMYERCVEDLKKEELEELPMPEEFRCCICYRRDICPAYDTGVLFPCPHYKEEEHGKEE